MMSDSCTCTVDDFVVGGNTYGICEDDFNINSIFDLLRMPDSRKIDVTPA
jgi:hypothetical protein